MSERIVCTVAAIGFCAVAAVFLLWPNSDLAQDGISHIVRWPAWARAEHLGIVLLLFGLGFLYWGWRRAGQ